MPIHTWHTYNSLLPLFMHAYTIQLYTFSHPNLSKSCFFSVLHPFLLLYSCFPLFKFNFRFNNTNFSINAGKYNLICLVTLRVLENDDKHIYVCSMSCKSRLHSSFVGENKQVISVKTQVVKRTEIESAMHMPVSLSIMSFMHPVNHEYIDWVE